MYGFPFPPSRPGGPTLKIEVPDRLDDRPSRQRAQSERFHPELQDWEVEESLDVEWAHAIAPKANIILVEANSVQQPRFVRRFASKPPPQLPASPPSP